MIHLQSSKENIKKKKVNQLLPLVHFEGSSETTKISLCAKYNLTFCLKNNAPYLEMSLRNDSKFVLKQQALTVLIFQQSCQTQNNI